MKKDKNTLAEPAGLRRLAEERLREKRKSQRSEVGGLPAITLAKMGQRTEEETQRLLHELQVHQIELGMQNEELRQSRAEVEAGLERYTDLYDFAPVGYVTLGRDGTIRQVNLTGARLLGVERAQLVNRRFGRFVSEADRPAFNAFLQKVFESQEKGTCDVALLKEGNHPPSSRLSGGQEYGEAGPLCVRIEATVSEDGQECRAVVVDITERKRAEEALRRYANRLGALRQIDRAILAAQSPQAIAEAALKHIRRMIPCQRASVVLFDEEAQERVVLAADTDGPSEVHTGSRAPLERGDLVPCFRRGEAYLVPDLQALSAPTLVEAALGAEGIRTRLSLPLIAQGNLLGALNFGAITAAALTTEQLEIGREVTDQLAVVLQQARLHAAAVRRGEELAALLRAARTVMSGLDLQETLDRILGEAAQISGCSHVKVLLVDKEAGVLRVGALQGTAMPPGFQLPLGVGHSGLVASTGQPLFCADAQNDPRSVLAEADRERGIVTYLGLPIKSGDEVLGVLTFNTTEPHQYSPEELGYLAAFADQVAVAIENARLYEATVRQLNELKALHEIGRAIASSLTLDERLGALLERLVRAAGAQRVMVSLVETGDGGCCRLRVAYDYSKADPWLRHLDLSPQAYPEIQEALQMGRPLVIPDVYAEPLLAPLREHLEPLDLRSLVVLPLIVRERAIGAVSLGYVGQRRNFTNDEIQFYQNMAHLAAAAIANAQLFEQVARDKAEWEHTFGSIPELVAVMDAEYRLVRVNRAIAERLGMAPESLVGQLCYAVMHGTDAPWPGCPHAQALATGKPATAEVKDPHLGGIFLVTVSPLLNAEGQTVGFVHIARDITESKRTEEEARQRQRFEDVSRAKSAFIATMSHELRTPLNSVIGFAKILLEQGVGPLTEKQGRFLTHIRNSGKHLLQLIGDILDLSKIEAGKFILQPELLPIAQTLEDILVIARGLANKKGQTIERQIESGLPLLQADPVRFKQILFNLLSNAVKFTPEHGTITLRAYQKAEGREQKAESRRQKAEGSGQTSGELPPLPTAECPLPSADCRLPSLVIEVADTGIGIKAEDLPRLFREFVQLETTQAQKHEGTGLGLALTKRLVELHGGRIWAESKGEGRGSTFAILLPFVATVPKSAEVESPGIASLRRGSSERALTQPGRIS